MLTMSFSLPSYAETYNTGDTISFRHRTIDAGDYFTTSEGFEGCCAELGLPSASSGTAKVTVRRGDSKTAKIVWHYGIQKGWAFSDEQYRTWAYNYGGLVQDLIRASEMGGLDAWEAAAGPYFDPPSAVVEIMQPLWDALDSLSPAPDSLEVYYCDQGPGNQNFVIWKYEENGKLKLKKVSNNTSITG